MAHFRTTINSRLAAEAAFTYMATFSNALEWDPGVVEAERLDAGELRRGSSFRIVSVFAGRRVPLRYEITRLEQGHLVVLEAWSTTFGSVDTIIVEPDGTGCRVTYEARLVPKGAMRLADPLLQLLFGRVGRAAEASLQQHLNPAAPAAR